ncbi:ABC transporter substrate-binding protein [Kocuria sp. CPCC 205268]|uniref:ABC transporter substrate-binding protein n=1 Tax=Kocuria oxytropis TaxID=3058913 RepID=UPI0034D70E18
MQKTGAALAAAAVLTVTACGGGEPGGAGGDGELTTVSIGVIASTDVAPLYLGIEQGFFEEEGLELEITQAQGGAAIVPSVVSGELDFGFSNVTSLIVARSQGLPLQIVANANNSTGVRGEDFADVLVRGDSDIQDAADLEGRTVGVNTLNNISDTTIRAAIEAQGGDPGNVEFVEIPLPDMPAALDRGEVDAIGSIEPFRTIALQDGARSAVSNYAFPIENLTVAVYFTTDEVVAEEPEMVESFRAAIEKSLEYAQDNPDEVRAVLPSYTQLDEGLIDQLVLPSYPTEVNRQSVQELADLAVQHGLIEEAPDLDELLPE